MKISTNTLLTLKQRGIPGVLMLLLTVLFSAGANAQTQIAAWSFPTEIIAPNTPTTFVAEFGTQTGTAELFADGTNGSSAFNSSQLSMFGGSTINDPKASPSNTSSIVPVGNSANGYSFVFKISMTGFENPELTYATRGTGTGFTTHEWGWSIDGVNFTSISTITGRNSTSYSLQTVDFSSADGLDNSSEVYFRVTFSGATGASGNNRLDNIQIHAEELPANPPVITPPPGGLLMGAVGEAFSYTVTASNSPTSFAVASGTLPNGLTLNTTTGEITGTPTAADFYSAGITATNDGGTSAEVTHDFFIDLGNQTISFDPLAAVTYGDAPFDLTATASSGLPVSFSSDNPFVASISGNTVTIVGAGTANITASQSGDVNYNPATDVTHALVVNKAGQTITFDPIPDKSTADPDFNLDATASSGLIVSYSSSDPNVATVVGNTVTIVGPGTTTITATQAGNANFEAADPVDQTLLVTDATKLDQTITFTLADATYGDAPLALNGTASSSLPVSYSSSNPSVASVSGSTLTIHAYGYTTITATQDGDDDYNPATPVEINFFVAAKWLTVDGIVALSKVYDGTNDAPLDLTGATLNGVIMGDDVTFAATAYFDDPNAGIDKPVNVMLSLMGADNQNYKVQLANNLWATIHQAAQAISFDPLPVKTTNDAPFQLTATATSGLPVSYFIDNPLVATVAGDIVTIVGPGTANIFAQQSGNMNYIGAPSVQQELVVVAAPSEVTWNFGTSSANPDPSSGTPVNNLTISSFDQGNNANTSQTSLQLNTSSTSGGSGFSGSYNASITAENEGFDADVSAYFEFTLTPAPGFSVTLSELEFAARSTSTGPTEVAIYTSADNFTNSIDVLNPNNNSNWVLLEPSFTAVTSSSPLTVRIYGYQPGGTGTVGSSSANNWRLDDVTVTLFVEPLQSCTGTPEAGTAAADAGPFCESGSANLTATGYTLPEDGNGISLQWYVSTDNVNFTPVVDATTDELSTGTLTTTTYYYMEVTCSGSGLSDVTNTVTVVVNPAPDAPVISGNASFCTGSSTTLTSTPAASYAWFLDGNPTGMNSINHQADAAGAYTVQITDANGCTAVSAEHIVIESATPATPIVSGPTNVCEYVGTGIPVFFTASFDANASSYTWTVPPTVTILSGQGTNTLEVTINNGFIALANKQIRVVANGSCGTSGIGIKYLAAQFPVTAAPINGPANVCDFIGTGAEVVYSIAPVVAATGYVWTLPAGVNLVEDNGTSITVTFTNDFVTSNILVRATNPCGTSPNRAITVSRVNPSTPGLISGVHNACLFMPTSGNPAGTHAFYSVPLVSNATSYQWTVPAGMNILNQTSTATDNVIEVEVTPAFTSGSITVSAVNNCGTSAVRSFLLTAYKPATPSAIDAVQVGTCPNRVYAYSLTGMPANTTELIWTVPDGGTIISGEGTASIQVSYTDEPIAGSVSVTAYNGCGNSGTRTLGVKLPGCPPPAMKQPVSAQPAISGVEVETLDATIFPNPSTAEFRLKVSSKAEGQLQLRVMDITGKTVTTLRARAGEVVAFGNNLRAGTYFVEVLSGSSRKVVKVIKQ